MRDPLRAPAALALVLSLAGLARADRVVLVAGGGAGGDGAPAGAAKLVMPFGTDFDAAGTLYFVELTGGRVGKIGGDGTLSIVAGSGMKGDGGDGGPAAKAEFNGMHSLAVTKAGDVYVADTWNNRVRKIDHKTGLISNVAGTGVKGFSGDGGPAAKAEFGGVYCLALDEARGELFLADLDNRRVRRVDLATGVVTTVAGDGTKGVPVDGASAVKAPLVDPRAVAVDGKGGVYVLERSGHALRYVDASGKVTTVAGTGKAGKGGDGGPALKAAMNGPKHLTVAPSGDVVIADTENHRVRAYRPADGTMVNLVGTGAKGAAGVGGPPAEVELSQPHGVTYGPGGVLFISDSANNRILKVVP